MKQVGGDHYRGDYQHWDWCVDHRLGYLEGYATKYLPRWRLKGGVEDLRKCRSVVEKMMEGGPDTWMTSDAGYSGVLRDAARVPGLRDGSPELMAASLIASATAVIDLEKALLFIDDLIEENTPVRKPQRRTEHPAPHGYEGDE